MLDTGVPCCPRQTPGVGAVAFILGGDDVNLGFVMFVGDGDCGRGMRDRLVIL